MFFHVQIFLAVARLPNDKQNDSVICQPEVQKTGQKKETASQDWCPRTPDGILTSSVRQKFKPGLMEKF